MSDEQICPTCGRPIPPDAPGGVCPVCLLSAANVSSHLDSLGGARDTNLLFALFAHLLRYLDAEQFVEAIDAWANNPSVSIADNLVDRGVLSKASRQYLDGLLAHGLDFYAGNVSKTLESLGGHERVATILQSGATASTHDLVRTRLDLKLPEDFFESDATPGTTLEERPGRYTRSSEYSRGGMGRILLVHDELLARDIALKELLPPSDVHMGEQGLEASPVKHAASLVARFLREARVTGRLEHPSIVPVYELGRRENGSLYYTMRLVRGKTLRVVLQECKTLEDRLKLLPNFVDVCMGVAYAHSRGVVHRDIKPSNIMIGEFGETVIIDWGLAKVVGTKEPEHPPLEDTLHKLHGAGALGPDKTITGEFLGSPHYASPEQAAGRIEEIDARSDVFSLGVLLYEILADHAAFDKTTLEALIEQIQYEEPVPIAKREPRAPKELSSICYRAIQKERGQRYSSAKELAEDVNRFLSGSLVSTYNYSFLERFRHFYGQHRIALNALVVSVAAIALTVAIAFIRVDKSRDDAIVARNSESAMRQEAVQARDAEASARVEAETVGYHNAIVLASELLKNRNFPAARDALWTAQPAHRQWEWGYLIRQAYVQRYEIKGYAGIQEQPGNRILASFYRNRPISIRDINSNNVLFELPVPPIVHVRLVEISPTETHLAALFGNGSVRMWDLSTREELYVKPPTTGATSIAFSRDGTTLLVAREAGAVELWETASGSVKASFSGAAAPADWARFSPDERYLYAYVGTETGRQVQVWETASQQSVLLVPGTFPSMSSGNLLAAVADGKVAIWNAGSGQALEVNFAHTSSFHRAVFRPGGSELLAWSADLTVSAWDAVTGARIRSYDSPDDVYQFVLSQDGSLMATCDFEGDRYNVWDVSTGVRLREVPGLPLPPIRMAFSANGSLLLAATDSLTGAWDVQFAGQRVLRQLPSLILGRTAVSLDGSQLVYLTGDGRTQFVGIGGPDPNVGLFVFGPGSRLVAALNASGDEAIVSRDEFAPVVFDVQTGVVASALRGHSGPVTSIDCDPVRRETATGAWDGKVRIWAHSTGTLLRTLEGHTASVIAVRYSPNGNRLLSVDDAGGVRLWDAATGVMVAQTTLAGEPTAAAWSPSNDTVAIGNHAGEVHVLDATTLVPSFDQSATSTQIYTMQYLNSKRIISADRPGLHVWNVSRGTEILTIPGAMAQTGDLHVLSNGLQLLTRESHALRVWEARLWDDGITRTEFEAQPLLAPEPPTDTRGSLPSRVVVVTTPELLLDALRRLRDAASQALPAPDSLGVDIAEGAMERAVIRLGLIPGDSLGALARTEVRTGSELAAALTAQITELESAPGPMELRVVRGGATVLFQVVTLPLAQSEETIQLAASDATDILSAAIEAIGAQRRTLNEQNRERTLRFGNDGMTSDFIAGFCFGGYQTDVDRDRLLRLGMTYQDVVHRIDGVEVNRVEVFENALRTALDRIRAGSPVRMQLDIARGDFQRITLTVNIQ